MLNDRMSDLHVDTRITRIEDTAPEGFRSLAPATHRGSTILFDDAQSFLDRGARFFDGYTYGLAGTPTQYLLAAKIAEIEGGRHCVLAPSGLAAIHLVNQSVLSAGAEVLIPSSAYGPTQRNANELLARFDVKTRFYDPAAGAHIADVFTPRTRLVWAESPGSLTMQIQDIPAIVAAAHARGIKVALDNTWASPLFFDALGHGVDFAVQALTKYACGHSDILMGSVATNDEQSYRSMRTVADLMGMNVSPDDCVGVMRGLGTMSVRLQRHQQSATQIAQWLAKHPAIRQVMYPALRSDPGHGIWQRDFKGSSGLLSITLERNDLESACRMVNRLKLFQIGASWGGVHSLVAIYPSVPVRQDDGHFGQCTLVRLHIGLEAVKDLIMDLDEALAQIER